MTPRLSIITPLYRSAGTVERCMASVRTAAEACNIPVEHLLVLDGPDSETQSAISRSAVSPLVGMHVIGKPHSGIADTRNVGLAAAASGAVTLLDADDELTAARLKVISSRPLASAVIGTQDVRDSGGAVPGIWRLRLGDEQRLHYLTSIVLPIEWAREIGGFDASFSFGDEWDFVIRVKSAGYPIEYRDEVFAIRHVTESNASHDTAALASDFIRGVRNHLHRMPDGAGIRPPTA